MFSCSYCITCKARGKLRSFPVAEIKNNVKDAIRQGCKEIRITAQDTASYGLDIGLNLGVLLKEIVRLDGDYRVRVGMMNPYTLKKNFDEILNWFQNTKIYNFIHLPFQSGSNNILRKMNRKYTVEEFEVIVKKFRNIFPNLTLATDVIVGFPTESDEDFQKTVKLLETVKPDITNITRFSARPFTEAKKMKGRVDTKISKTRSKFLTDFCSNISKENNKKFVGKNFDVLITERGKNNTMISRTDCYKPVVLKEKNLDIGQTINVKILKAENTYLVGNI
jgi:threonylcarbamoyladenosine tRNA methylthiotransferase CDKAL1